MRGHRIGGARGVSRQRLIGQTVEKADGRGRGPWRLAVGIAPALLVLLLLRVAVPAGHDGLGTKERGLSSLGQEGKSLWAEVTGVLRGQLLWPAAVDSRHGRWFGVKAGRRQGYRWTGWRTRKAPRRRWKVSTVADNRMHAPRQKFLLWYQGSVASEPPRQTLIDLT